SALSNYNTPVITDANLVIIPKPVTVTNTDRTTTYDGVTNYNSLTSGTAFTVGAMVGSDAVATVTQTPSGFSGVSSGTAQAGTFTVTPSTAVLSTGTASNYSFSYVPSTHTIDKANLSVSATPSLIGNVYNGNAFTGSYTTTALNGETFTVTGQATGTNAGTYTSALNVSGAALANYNTPVITNANLVISPKPVTVTNTDRTTTYDGVSTYASLAGGTSFTTSTMVGNDAVGSLTQTPSSNGPANTGTFTVTPSAAALSTGTASNYDFTYVPSTHTVNKAALTLTASTNTKNFDGKTDAQAIPTVSGLKGSDTVSNLVEAYSDVNPGTGKTLTVQAGYQISDGNQGRNYTVTLVPDQTGEIRAQAVAVLPPEAPSASNNIYAPPTLTLFAASATVAPESSASSSSASASSVSIGSSSGVVVNTISSPTTQVNGLVAVLVPSGTATAGTGLVIALPEQVLTSNAASASVKVTLPNNEPLPSWIRYDAATQTLVTTAVPTGAFPLSVVVTVDGKSTIIQISESKTFP
ncbi:MAG: YDG domain-containing protein, partial [Burkholderiales bacterium]|nr:YDG domain-containing protein [Burkholderiales bacterium]